MGFEGNIGFLRFFRPLGAPGHENFLDRSSRAFGDFTAGSTSGMGGSLAVISSAEGAVVASLFGSSSSLQKNAKGNRFYTTQKGKKANTTKS
jgi:hypothetical protein